MTQSTDATEAAVPGWLAKEPPSLPDAAFDHFFELSIDMLCIAGFDGHFKRLNKVWEEVTGFSVEELTRRPYLDFIHPDDIARTNDEVVKQQDLGLEVLSFENRYLCADGTYKWLRWTSKPQLEHQLMYAVARDVTEEKRVVELLETQATALERSNQELEDFTYVISHDLKEPLRGMEAFSAFLAEDCSEQLDDEGKRYVSVIRDSAIRMRDLIDDLLELSRISRTNRERQVVSVTALIDEARRNLDYALTERAVVFQVTGPDAWIACDPVRIKQVLENLISNSVKYNDKLAATVDVVIAPGEEFHTISVRDNAIGIDPRFQEKVFGIFQRLVGREEYEGTGVGLTICKKIVEAHGGNIWLESAGEGEGSTFHFTVPAASTPTQE